MKQFYVYILGNWNDRVLYIGVTGNLERRLFEHKHKLIAGFTEKYNINKLLYYEVFDFAPDALRREKQLKSWRREKKDNLITNANPEWKDLGVGWDKDPSTSLGMTQGKYDGKQENI